MPLTIQQTRERLRELELFRECGDDDLDRVAALAGTEARFEAGDVLYREGDPDETILVRIPTGKGPRFRWKDHYLIADPKWGEMQYAVNISGETRRALSSLPEASQTETQPT